MSDLRAAGRLPPVLRVRVLSHRLCCVCWRSASGHIWVAAVGGARAGSRTRPPLSPSLESYEDSAPCGQRLTDVCILVSEMQGARRAHGTAWLD